MCASFFPSFLSLTDKVKYECLLLAEFCAALLYRYPTVYLNGWPPMYFTYCTIYLNYKRRKKTSYRTLLAKINLFYGTYRCCSTDSPCKLILMVPQFIPYSIGVKLTVSFSFLFKSKFAMPPFFFISFSTTLSFFPSLFPSACYIYVNVTVHPCHTVTDLFFISGHFFPVSHPSLNCSAQH